MRLIIPFLVSFLLSSGLTATTGFSQTAASKTPVELALPVFQESSMERDMPAVDIFFGNEQELWVLGQRSLWSWNLTTKKLRRIPLASAKAEAPGFTSLGTDGVSLFAAAKDNLFQIQLNPKRVLLYRNPFAVPGESLGLAGEGEHFYWLHTTALMQVDRYGKAVVPRVGNTALKITDKVAFSTETMQLFYARGKRLIRVDLAAKGEARPSKETVILKAEHPLLDVQLVSAQSEDTKPASPVAKQNLTLMVHTAHTVLVLNQNGKIAQSIPVEGTRTLHKMNLQPDQHSYLFSDALFEVFKLKNKQSHKYRLPLETTEAVAKITKIATAGNLVAILSEGQPRVFSLEQEP